MPSPRARSWSAARGRRLAGWLLACALFACTPSAAWAQGQVLLLAPETPDPVLIELYHRLEAELRIHGFDTVTLVSAGPQDSASSMLGAQASARRAFAAITVVLRNRNAALDVWLVDRDTGRTELRTLTASAGDETANLVAVRAVDLLRVSLAARSREARDPAASQAAPVPQAPATATRPEPKPDGASGRAPAAQSGNGERPAQDNREGPAASASAPKPDADTAPERAEEAAPASAEPSRPQPNPFFVFRAEAFGLWQGPRFGVALGPSLGVSVAVLKRLRVAAMAAGTRGLRRLETSFGTAALQQELFGIELELAVLSRGPLQLTAAGGAGVMLLQAEGHAIAPLKSMNAAQWTWMVSLGPRVSVALSENWSLTAAVRVRLYMPDVAVAVTTEMARLGRPSGDIALGLAFTP